VDIYGVTNLNALGVAIIFCMGVLILLVPRAYVRTPLLLVSLFTTIGQQLVLGGFNLTILRILLAFGWVRILLRGEAASLKRIEMDGLVFVWVVVRSLANFAQVGTISALVNRVGQGYDILGTYFLFRSTVRNEEEVRDAYRSLALLLVPLALLMLTEKLTGRNLFAVFGGVPEFSMVRDGRLRAQGPFRHPILAGTLGAVLMPVFVSMCLGRDHRDRRLSILGLCSSTVLIIVSASSGPLLACGASMVGLMCWRVRTRMSTVRRMLVSGVIALDLVMKAPIWYIFARLGVVTGGTGDHRSALIDAAVRHLPEWWLYGTSHTSNWLPYTLRIDPEMVDVTNQYLREGIDGGMLPMALFVWIIVRAFRQIGAVVQSKESRSDAGNWGSALVAWGIGCSILAHVVSFFSVSYFDQMSLLWYMLLAQVASMHTGGEPLPVRAEVGRAQLVTG
jgi:hypothetical protein